MTNSEVVTSTQTPLVSNRMYDVLKNVVQLLLPALAAFYLTIAVFWGLPKAEEVAATLAALATLLGVFLKASERSYNASDAKYDGAINIATTEAGAKVFTLEIDDSPEDIEDMKAIVFKVNADPLTPPE